MGKGKVKPKMSAEKSAIKTAKKQAKRAARESSGVKKPNTKPKAKSSAQSLDTSTEDTKSTTSSFRAANGLSQAKWSSLFKKHIGVLESHVKHLERVLQSVRHFVSDLPEVERGEWERGEKGDLVVVVGCVDRAKETVKSAKEAATLLLSAEGATARTHTFPDAPVNDERDSEMEDVPTESDEEEAEVVKDESAKSETNGAAVVEDNPYFVVDTKPTPVVINKGISPPRTKKNKNGSKEEYGSERETEKPKSAEQAGSGLPEPETVSSSKKSKEAIPEEKADAPQLGKKRRKSEDSEPKKPKKSKKEIQLEITTSEPVDFAALQAKLQAEVDIGEAAKEVAIHGGTGESKKDKKRRRSSDGLSKDGKKAKKEEERKRKAEGESIVVSR
jgi:hypothetical protein